MGAVEQPVVSVNVGSRFHLALSISRLVVVSLLVLLLAFCVWYGAQPISPGTNDGGWHATVGSVGVNLVCIALGLALAPSPRPTDFSGVAVIAVNAIAERARATATLIENLDTVAGSDELSGAPVAKLRLAMVQQELERQRQSQVQEFALWARVSPGSEDEIVKNRQTGAAMLEKLERELGDERN